MSTIRSLMSVVLLAMAACVTEAPGTPDTAAEAMDNFEGTAGPVTSAPVGGLPGLDHPDRMGPHTGDDTTLAADACSLLRAGYLQGISDAIRRAIVLMDRDPPRRRSAPCRG